NPSSLDWSIQSTLSSLFPPFEATAPTVLSQLFRTIEERYHGDALQCLLDYLIPAKHILESVQQAACAEYSDVLFLCEGWPLCLRDRVVIQLAPINPLLLRPGDFYLQVEPFGEQSARIVLKSLLVQEDLLAQENLVGFRAQEGPTVEEAPIPETSYPCIFTETWLKEVNEGRHGYRLQRCVLTSDQGIVKVPWTEVVNPEFLDRPKVKIHSAAMTSCSVIMQDNQPPEEEPESQFTANQAPLEIETMILPAKDGVAVSVRLVESGSRLVKVDQGKPVSHSVGKPVGRVSPNTWDSRHNRELEGEYVDLLDFAKDKEVEKLTSRSLSDVYPEIIPMVPAIHAMQSNKCTAFGLASPILDRKKAAKNGSRDRVGRAVLEVHGGHTGWARPTLCPLELCRLLLYLHSVPRRAVRDLGLTIVIDSRKSPPPSVLYKALLMVQEQTLHAVHSILLLVDKDQSPRPERKPGLQVDIVTSLKALHKTIEGHQLTSELGGTFPYNHTDWLQFQQKLSLFELDLQGAALLLERAIKNLDSSKKTDMTQDVKSRIQEQKSLMREVLEDARMVTLQREGGAMLARMRKEEFRFAQSEDYRDSMEAVTCLYNQVEEGVHTLVIRSNQSLQRLDHVLILRETEEELNAVRPYYLTRMWCKEEEQQWLKDHKLLEETRERLEQRLADLHTVLTQAKEKKEKQLMLIKDVEKKIQGTNYPETDIFHHNTMKFKTNMAAFQLQAEQYKSDLESFISLYHFCEKALSLTKECIHYLEHMEMGSGKAQVSKLKIFEEKLRAFSPWHFEEERTKVRTMHHPGELRVWEEALAQCQFVRQRLEEILLESDENQTSQKPPLKDAGVLRNSEAPLQASSPCKTSASWEDMATGPWEAGAASQAQSTDNNTGSDSETVSCFHLRYMPGGKSRKGGCAPMVVDGLNIAKNYKPSMLQDDQESIESHQDSLCSSNSSNVQLEWIQMGVSNPMGGWEEEGGSSAVHPDDTAPDSFRLGPVIPDRMQESSSCSRFTALENDSNALKLQHIMEELLHTEREYVKALCYVMEHYFPELERPDVPQDLRGQRGNIFGNLEKLRDFHQHHFLKELEFCLREPFLVGRCFLRHKESFGLYALYSKNKPCSDNLLIHYGKEFFKQKQQQLGDKMDLSSYLLRPVQRISKYSLLLQDMLGEWDLGSHEGHERAEIQAALEVIQFQLRHGNNLLAMDDIQECDTSDIGMTHNCGDSGLCFEIWFRRRKLQDTYTLQAASREMKGSWTKDLERILWEQAIHNREVRMQERVFMGIGYKPFMDIKPSEAAICDRAINCALTGQECKPAVSSGMSDSQVRFPAQRPNSTGSTSWTSSGSHSPSSSSSSGRCSMSPVSDLIGLSRRGVSAPGHGRPNSGVLEEYDIEQEKGIQILLVDSSESSGESVSGFSSSSYMCEEHSEISIIGVRKACVQKMENNHQKNKDQPKSFPKLQNQKRDQPLKKIQADNHMRTSTEV
ncbi:hypothetical protein P4O66_009562, partial [Electrophorus voltai]